MRSPVEVHDHTTSRDEGWLSRERAMALALVVASVVVFYLCYRIVLPFLPALAWALALAIVAHPVHHWIHRRIKYSNIAAGLAVFVVTLAIVIPVIFLTHTLIKQAEKYSQQVQKQISDGKWRDKLKEYPVLRPVVPWIESQLGVATENSETEGSAAKDANSESDRDVEDLDQDRNEAAKGTAGQRSRQSAAANQKAGNDDGASARTVDGRQNREANSSPAQENAADKLIVQGAALAQGVLRSGEKDAAAGQGGDASGSGEQTSGTTEMSSDRRQQDRDGSHAAGGSNASSAGSESSGPSAAAVGQAASMIGGGMGTLLSGTVWMGMQLLITLLSLFFFFRDRRAVLRLVRSLMPLSETETDEVFSRVSDTIHGTLYGSVVVAMVQGAMGGLIFWWLELPAPLLWGAVMGLLAVVPVLGTFVVWAPTAAFLALTGEFTSAIVLVLWGTCAIGLIDNLLYPYLVGKKLRFHTLLVFFALVGGLMVFGASGIILGPFLLSIADALLDVWRRRTAYGGTIEGGVSAEGA